MRSFRSLPRSKSRGAQKPSPRIAFCDVGLRYRAVSIYVEHCFTETLEHPQYPSAVRSIPRNSSPLERYQTSVLEQPFQLIDYSCQLRVIKPQDPSYDIPSELEVAMRCTLYVDRPVPCVSLSAPVLAWLLGDADCQNWYASLMEHVIPPP